MRLHLIQAALADIGVESEVIGDYSRTYRNVEFGSAIPGASAWALFLQSLKRIGLSNFHQDINGNWQAVSETMIVNIGPVQPKTLASEQGQKRIPVITVTTVSPDFDQAFEAALRNNTLSFLPPVPVARNQGNQ